MTEYDKWTVAALAEELELRGERAGKKKAAMVSRLQELDRERQKKKRPREDDNERTLGEVDGAAAELVCAITQELPVDPVIARDGRVYERAAIEKWFERDGPLKSPVTNEPMKRKLLPAVQVRNMIERMVKSGALKGEKVDAWAAKIQIDDKRTKVIAAANGGDVDAMLDLHEAYYWGQYNPHWQSRGTANLGVDIDEVEATRWAKKASDAGSAIGMYLLAHDYEHGLDGGVNKDHPMAVYLLTKSAMNGYDKSCFVLGSNFARESKDILPTDLDAAALWLRKSVDVHATTPTRRWDNAQLDPEQVTWMKDWLAWNEERKGPAPIHPGDEEQDDDASDDEDASLGAFLAAQGDVPGL